jgi:hypothetical protein
MKLLEYINLKTDQILEKQTKEETKLYKDYIKEIESMTKEMTKVEKPMWNNKYFKSLYIIATNDASGNQYSLRNLDNWIVLCKKLSEIKEFKTFAKKVISICEEIKKGTYDELGINYNAAGLQKNVGMTNDRILSSVEGKWSVIHKLFAEFAKGYNETYKLF